MAPRHRAPSAAQPSCPALLGTRRPARTRPSMASNNRAYPRRPPALLGAAHGDPVDQERKRDDPALVLLGSPCGPQGRGHGCPRASRRHGMRHRETPAPPHEPGRLHLPGGPLGCRSLYSGHPALRPFGAGFAVRAAPAAQCLLPLGQARESRSAAAEAVETSRKREINKRRKPKPGSR